MRLPASTQSARPVPPVRDESARAPKHPDTSQRKGLASSHFRRGFPRSPYSGIGSARWPPRRSSLDPPPADPAPAGILDVGGQLPEFGCPSPEFAGVHWPARSKPAGLGAGGRHCCTASTAPDGRPMMLSACFTACPFPVRSTTLTLRRKVHREWLLACRLSGPV